MKHVLDLTIKSKMNFVWLLVLTMATASFFTACNNNKTTGGENGKYSQKVDSILSGMTLEEKVGQMTQVTLDILMKGENRASSYEPIELDMDSVMQAFGKYKTGSVLNTANNRARTPEKWNEIVATLQEVCLAETGIPLLYGIDAIHGATYTAGATLFPQQIGQAATFNPPLVEKASEITAYETRASSIPWTFSPVMDMGRDPRWARMWETYGESQYLNAVMGIAAVEGYQGTGEDIDKNHIAACLKHFLAYASNSGKDRTPINIASRQLHEIYVPSFAAAITAGAKTVMGNSGIINGIPAHASHDVMTTLLRDELGFEGVLVTDWSDINNLYTRDHFASSKKDAVKLAINAGIDMAMVPYEYDFCTDLVELVNEGAVPLSRIDEAVRRILTLKYELGLFDHPVTLLSDYPDFGCDAFENAALETAIESISLLKNEKSILPLEKNKRVLVCGPNANSMRTLNGGWSYSWQGEKVEEFAQDYHTILESIQDKIGEANMIFSEGVSYNMAGNFYLENTPDIGAAVKAAAGVDHIILCLGENSYCEKPGDLHDLYLSDNQTQLALELAKTGKPLILILNEGRPRIISKIEYLMDAVVQIYLPGNFGGEALAEVLYGDANPSGKLPYTYPMFPNSLITYDYKLAELQQAPEGMYNYASDMAVQYEFGHGLSYTTFEYSDFEVSKADFDPDDTLSISIKIKNTGKISGKEVVMLYSSDEYASIAPDNKKLIRFKKIELQAGESKTVSFDLSASDLAFYNSDNLRIAEKGDFILRISNFEKKITLSENITFGEPSSLRL